MLASRPISLATASLQFPDVQVDDRYCRCIRDDRNFEVTGPALSAASRYEGIYQWASRPVDVSRGCDDVAVATVNRAIEQLAGLRAEIHSIAAGDRPRMNTTAFTSWHARTQSALMQLLGAEHHIMVSFVQLRWTPQARLSAPGQAPRDWDTGPFRNAANQAEGYLEAAAVEVQARGEQSSTLNAAGVDPELWEFVRSDIEGEHWGKAASQATLFIEDRIRKWTGQPAEVVGVDLMRGALGPGGNYRLGLTDNEKDGWHQFGRGIVMALRNAAQHRIVDRPDHRPYVLGVVGACSLLLTQLRYEHGNRFADLSLVEHEA